MAAALAFAQEMGYDRVINTVTFAVHHLVKSPSLQNRVRRELKQLIERYHGLLSYETLMQTKWLDAVVLGDSQVFLAGYISEFFISDKCFA